MKNFLTVAGILLSGFSIGQSVGVNNATPDPTAILDIRNRIIEEEKLIRKT